MQRATATAPSHQVASSSDPESIEVLKTLARALGRQDARRMFAAAMKGDVSVAEPQLTKPFSERPGRLRAAR